MMGGRRALVALGVMVAACTKFGGTDDTPTPSAAVEESDAGLDSSRPAIPGMPEPPDAFPLDLAGLTGLWRASYTGSPWSAVGGAVRGDLIADAEGTVAPTVGSAQNGKTPATFANQVTSGLLSGKQFTEYAPREAGSVWCVFKASVAPDDKGPADRVDNNGMLAMNAGSTTFSVGYASVAGVPSVTVAFFDGAYKEPVAPASLNEYHLAFVRWDGDKVGLAVDGGSIVDVAAGAMDQGALGTVAVGRSFALREVFDGSILEVGLVNRALSDADRSKLRAYVDSTYALSL